MTVQSTPTKKAGCLVGNIGFTGDPTANKPRWSTKDSGKREEHSSGMVRDTREGKPRFDLMVPVGVPYEEQMLTRFAGLLERGARKYSERNWEKANTSDELERAKDSAFRHFMQWLAGEDDEDHAAAVWFNILEAETIAYKLRSGQSTKD